MANETADICSRWARFYARLRLASDGSSIKALEMMHRDGRSTNSTDTRGHRIYRHTCDGLCRARPFDEAWRCIVEAMTAMERTKESMFEAEVYRLPAKLRSCRPTPDAAKAEAYFERALAVARQQQAKVLGTPRRHEPRTPLARPGQACSKRANCWLRFTGGSRRGSTRAI